MIRPSRPLGAEARHGHGLLGGRRSARRGDGRRDTDAVLEAVPSGARGTLPLPHCRRTRSATRRMRSRQRATPARSFPSAASSVSCAMTPVIRHGCAQRFRAGARARSDAGTPTPPRPAGADGRSRRCPCGCLRDRGLHRLAGGPGLALYLAGRQAIVPSSRAFPSQTEHTHATHMGHLAAGGPSSAKTSSPRSRPTTASLCWWT